MSDPQHTYLVLHSQGGTVTSQPATCDVFEVDIHATPADAWAAYLDLVAQNGGQPPKPEAFVLVGVTVADDLITFDWADVHQASELAP